ncbi:MAG: p-aminobenzoyl-glutamate transport protein [Chloroflexi bacterium OLB15]|nr:MAG: p-aminobenzoyl-glutamate transport protein [Chloroflexi bacterium OLB15]
MAASAAPAKQSLMQKILNGIERVGNKVPHPVLMFLYLMIGVIILSHILYLANVSVTEEIAVPLPVEVAPNFYEDSAYPSEGLTLTPSEPQYEIQQTTIAARSLLTTEGIRFIFTSFLPNFAGFSVVAVVFVAMMGAGVAEEAGLMGALIRKLVAVSPRGMLSFIIIFVGVLSSVATDAGYLILVPLGAAAFLSVKKHPLLGLAAAYGGTGAIFAVNLLIAPLDAMLTEVTNEAIGLAGGQPITVLSNFFFSVASAIIISIIAALITDRIVAPRLGEYVPEGGVDTSEEAEVPAGEGRGLRFAGIATLAFAGLIVLLTAPEGAPLRHPVTGEILGATPFMDSLIFIITMLFLVAGVAYGIGAKTITSSNDVIKAVTKTFSSLAGLVFMLLMISQFIAYFNYSNMPSIIAVVLAEMLEQSGLGALPLMIGMILVIMLLDIIIPGSLPKWAIFAPIFVPLFIRLGVTPQTVLAAYRVGDSPMNVVTPLMVYLPFMITVAQRYQKDAGIGTIIALMLPYTLIIAVAWIILFIIWFVLNIPLGPGYPVAG